MADNKQETEEQKPKEEATKTEEAPEQKNDQEKQEVENVDFEQFPQLSVQQRLDILLVYLRRVHAYCLYCGEEYEDERMLSTKCGPQHLRNHQKISEADFNEILQKSPVETTEVEKEPE